MVIRIHPPTQQRSNGNVLLSFAVEGAPAQKALTYELPEEHASLVAEDRLDAAAVALLLPAMLAGRDLVVQGTMSELLLHNLNVRYQVLMNILDPRLQRIEVTAEKVTTDASRAKGVAAGFSAGVDAFCTVADYALGDCPPSLRLTHLLFNDIGSHGRGASAKRRFETRLSHVRPVAEAIGLPLVTVRSNLDAFYDGITFIRSHSPRNASVALLLQQGIGRFYYSSGQCYSDVAVAEGLVVGRNDVLTLPLLSTERLDVRQVGSEYQRAEKAARIADVPASWTGLDVCVSTPKGALRNCSRCWKCMGTQFTFEMLGVLDRYAPVFDLDIYRANRARFIRRLVASKDTLEREALDIAVANGLRISASTRVLALFEPAREMSDKVRFRIRRALRDA